MPEAPFGIASVPFGELLAAVARGLADGQEMLDYASILQAETLAGFAPRRDRTTGVTVDEEGRPSSHPALTDTRIEFAGERVPLAALGFVATFYRFVDTVIELRVDAHLRKRANGETTLQTAPVDARYQAKYQLPPAQGIRLRAAIVAVPGPELPGD